jgi:hypothetical protein
MGRHDRVDRSSGHCSRRDHHAADRHPISAAAQPPEFLPETWGAIDQ